jgi:hypothetical protein
MSLHPFVALGALVAGIVSSAALAQTPPPQPFPQVPRTPDNRSGLPKAPPDIVRPGSAARPFTGNDEKQPPNTMRQLKKPQDAR